MGLSLVICKNEIERFDLVKENYNGNLPEFLIPVYFNLPLNSEFTPKKRLDYGSLGVSVDKFNLISYLSTLESSVLSWHVNSLNELIDKLIVLEDEKFMLVHYEF